MAAEIEVIELGDWPGSTLTAFECKYPESLDGGLDLILPWRCETHQRSAYWCLNASVLWCDGGPPDWEVHHLYVTSRDDESD